MSTPRHLRANWSMTAQPQDLKALQAKFLVDHPGYLKKIGDEVAAIYDATILRRLNLRLDPETLARDTWNVDQKETPTP